MKVTLKKEVEVEVKKLKVRAGARYWEDATVNGVEDTEGNLIPCREGDDFCPIIDLETGVILNWEQGKTADIHYKVCDDGDYYVLDVNDEVVLHKEGYVIDSLAIEDEGYGDYIIIKVDENGFINNWKFDVSDFYVED
jgi:hypothetical protein